MDRVLFAPRALPPLPPDVAQDPGPYAAWSTGHEQQRARAARVSRRSDLRLVMPVVRADPGALRRTLWSLRRQRSRWSLTVVTTDDQIGEVQKLARVGAGVRRWRRVSILGAAGGADERELLRTGFDASRGLPRALIFPGDAWAPDAVTLLSARLDATTVVYADEDQEEQDGRRVAPCFKPDFSPEFLLSSAYIGRPLAMGAAVVDQLPHFTATDTPGLEHECALAATDAAAHVVHIPEVLCHRSPGSRDAGPTRSSDRLTATRNGRDPAPTDVSVSIVIPFRDEPRLLRTCVDSIAATTSEHASVEIVLIDNGSTDPETLALVERLSERAGVTVLADPRPFNWAALSNAGVHHGRGDILLFLNNDIEAHRIGWLSALCAQALRPDVAAAGARLLYPDGRLQHCGLVVGLTGAAGHVLGGLAQDSPGYLQMARRARECSAVTGACLATRREIFDLLGGFDEALGVNLNDVDYCLRAAARGFRTIYEPAAELIHHESPSRGTAGGVGDIVEFVDRWKGYIAEGDPYLNPHLTRADPSCRLAGPEEKDDWKRWDATLRMQ